MQQHMSQRYLIIKKQDLFNKLLKILVELTTQHWNQNSTIVYKELVIKQLQGAVHYGAYTCTMVFTSVANHNVS